MGRASTNYKNLVRKGPLKPPKKLVGPPKWSRAGKIEGK